MTIPLKDSIVYGPVPSRRFGRSLGVNFLPETFKICNFDCVYCQYGSTPPKATLKFPSVSEIKSALLGFALGHPETPIDWITISGNGEPTLHPEFSKALDAVFEIRDRCWKKVPVGILSNSSTCHRPQIQDALLRLDGRFMKLDAGDPIFFEAIDRPLKGVSWGNIISGLTRLRNLTLQSMFVEGRVENTNEKSVSDWISAVGYIRPNAVQIYSLERPPSDERVLAVSRDRLQGIGERLKRQTGVEFSVF